MGWFGDYNPGGKLPFTVPKTVGQLPFNFPTKPGAQSEETSGGQDGIRSQVNGALYPFGHGLSYSTFRYDNLRISPSTVESRLMKRPCTKGALL